MSEVTTAAPVGLVPFGIATRAMRRKSYNETVNIFAGGTSFQPVQLTATGWVRRVIMKFTASFITGSAAAVVAGDAPFNLVSQVFLTDPTGKSIFSPVTGYQLYLINKYLPNGGVQYGADRSTYDPTVGAEYAYAASGTSGSAVFSLSLDFEVDSKTHYGCIPNLDANASLTLQVSASQYTNAFTGTTPSASTLKMEVYQEYFSPTGNSMGGAAVQDKPDGAGDYLYTNVQTATVSPSAENLQQVTGMGGVQQGIIAVSRAAGVRTAFTAGSNVGLVYDNTDIDSQVELAVFQNRLRKQYGLTGVDRATSYAPVTSGLDTGLDNGVLAWPFCFEVPDRSQWFRTDTGHLQQLRLTPGAAASQLEIITRTISVRPQNASAFYGG